MGGRAWLVKSDKAQALTLVTPVTDKVNLAPDRRGHAGPTLQVVQHRRCLRRDPGPGEDQRALVSTWKLRGSEGKRCRKGDLR